MRAQSERERCAVADFSWEMSAAIAPQVHLTMERQEADWLQMPVAEYRGLSREEKRRRVLDLLKPGERPADFLARMIATAFDKTPEAAHETVARAVDQHLHDEPSRAEEGDTQKPETFRNGIRIGLVWATGYALLLLIEDAPRWLKIATTIFPLLALAAMEFEGRIRKIHRRAYPAALTLIGIIYGGFLVYSVASPHHDPADITEIDGFIPGVQRIDFEKALRSRIIGQTAPDKATIRIYAEAANVARANIVAEMISAAGWTPERDSTDSPVLWPNFNIAPGITIRRGTDDASFHAWEALRQSLSQAHISYSDDASVPVKGPTRLEIGR